MTPEQLTNARSRPSNASGYPTRAARLRLALGEAFSATLLGVAESDLDVKTALGDRLLNELSKRGLLVVEVAGTASDLHRSFEFA
jgi:hypothetical protein